MIYFFIVLLSFPVFAKKECFKYQFEGAVKTLPGKFILITQSGTRSERKFEFDHKDIPKLAPYAEKFAKGEMILPQTDPVSGTKVLALTSIDFGIPEPLNTKKGLVKLGKVDCPKN
jgi:hypothetical protein